MWKRINIKKNMNVGGTDIDFYIEKRCYAKNGKLYPRLTLSISKYSYEDGFRISASIKTNSKAWWETTSIPFELKSEILQMLDKVTQPKEYNE